MKMIHRLRVAIIDPLLGFSQVAVVVLGVAIALYVGIWVLVVGGAADVLNLLKQAAEISPKQLGTAAIKIIAGLAFSPICVGGASLLALGLSDLKSTAEKEAAPPKP